MEIIFNEIRIFFDELINNITLENIIEFIMDIIRNKFGNTIIYTFIYVFIYLFLILVTIGLIGKINRLLEIKRSFKNRILRLLVRILNIIPIILLDLGYMYLIQLISFPITDFIYNAFKALSKISYVIKIII